MKVHLVDSNENWTQFQLVGDISSSTMSHHSRSPLDPLELENGELTTHLLFDLNNATYLDSSGIGWLLSVNRAAKDRGFRIVVHSVPPVIQRIFSMMRLGEVIQLAENFEAARKQIASEK